AVGERVQPGHPAVSQDPAAAAEMPPDVRVGHLVAAQEEGDGRQEGQQHPVASPADVGCIDRIGSVHGSGSGGRVGGGACRLLFSLYLQFLHTNNTFVFYTPHLLRSPCAWGWCGRHIRGYVFHPNVSRGTGFQEEWMN